MDAATRILRDKKILIEGIVLVIVLCCLFIISTVNFLLFHGIVELAGIVVALSIFVIIWNTRRAIPDSFFLIIGISFLFIGVFDLIHTLAYKGMGVFPGNSSDLPTQLWIAARYFQSIAFFIATFFIGKFITKDRNYDAVIVFASCTVATILLCGSIFVWHIFPPCYIDGTGLTLFKIASEYVISLILVATIVILYYKREYFEPDIWKLLVAAQVFLVLGELAFTSYISVYGFMNMLGHLFRLISVYLFYRAIVVVALTRPYDLLLRTLHRDEHDLHERFKELNCLYKISGLLEQPGISLTEILEKTTTFLPEAMQYPEISESRISFDGQVFQTAQFTTTPWMLARNILVGGNISGLVEICYREERPVIREGPFMAEERYLIDAVAERIGHIIERIRAAEALQASEKKYRTLFDNMLEGFAYCRMIYDEAGRPVDWEYLSVNPAFGRLTGLSDIAGKRAVEAIPGIREQTPELFETYGRVASFGKPESFEIDFTPLGLWLNVSVFSPEKGYFVAIFEDITLRKRAESALHESETKFREIFNSANDGIHLHEIDASGLPGRFVDVNEVACRMVGYRKEDLLHLSPLDLATDYHSRPLDQIGRDLVQGGSAVFETEHRKKDGGIIPVEINAHIVDIGGKKLVLSIIRDITERRKAEELLRDFNVELEQQVRAQTEEINASLQEKVLLLREVHHRVKNNFQIIISLTNLQMRKSTDPGVKKIIAETQNRIRAMSLVHEKLYLSESLSRIDFGDYVRFLTSSLFSYYSIDTRKVRVEISLKSIMLDIETAVPLGLVVNEIISNSLKHAFPDGRDGLISISGNCEGSSVTLIIRDNGVGIPVDFDWAHTDTLGMRLITSLVDQLDGTLELDRRDGTLYIIRFALKQKKK